MSKTKLIKQIENFSNIASFIYPLCPKFNNYSIKPFLEGAQVYAENFRSNVEFLNVVKLHKNFMRGSIDICTSLFENYEELKQKHIYNWSHTFFNLLHASKKVIDEIYNLAYTVGRNDSETVNLIENEKNPLVKFERKPILEESDYEIYRKSIFNWKCNIQSLYVEEQYMKHIVEICNSRNSFNDNKKYNPNEISVNKCTIRKTVKISDNNSQATPPICVLNAELISHKFKVEILEKNDKLTPDDINFYIKLYNKYQRELISFVFLNFSKLYNEMCVQCIKVFLEQQHSIIFNLYQKQKFLQKNIDQLNYIQKQKENIEWSDNNSSSNYETISSSSNFKSNICKTQSKIVGSLK